MLPSTQDGSARLHPYGLMVRSLRVAASLRRYRLETACVASGLLFGAVSDPEMAGVARGLAAATCSVLGQSRLIASLDVSDQLAVAPIDLPDLLLGRGQRPRFVEGQHGLGR
jgi:hypothetical protein